MSRDTREALSAFLPLPLTGQVGFLMACVTLALVVASVVISSFGSRAGSFSWTGGWAMAYALLLVLGWHHMRPVAGRAREYTPAVLGLIFQGLAYLLYWGAEVGGALGVERAELGALGEARDPLLVATLASLVVVGPASALFAALTLARGWLMVLAQAFGFLFFVVA